MFKERALDDAVVQGITFKLYKKVRRERWK